MLVTSPLFDAAWYALGSGEHRPREGAARDYLGGGRNAGLSPHPLFDPDYFASQHKARIGERDPLVLYLSNKASRKASPHPLFDVAWYVARVPAAKSHPLGPLGHYIDIGAREGVPPNDWYVPDPSDEPRGLIDWIEARATEWAGRRRPAAPRSSATANSRAPAPINSRRVGPRQDSRGSPRVTVVLVVGDEPALVPGMVESVKDQTIADWELLIVHPGDVILKEPLLDAARDPRIRIIPRDPDGDRISSLVLGLAEARGDYVAWIAAGDRWVPTRLESVLAEFARPNVHAVHDLVKLTPSHDAKAKDAAADVPPGVEDITVTWSPERVAMGWYPELASLVVLRTLAVEVGGFDPTVHRAAAHDFFLKVAAQTRPVLLQTLGVLADADLRKQDVAVQPLRERPSLDLPAVETWHDVVLNRHLVPWDELIERKAEPGAVSVVIPTFDDWRLTSTAVRSVSDAAGNSELTVQTLVVDNGSNLTTSVVLASLPLRFNDVQIISNAVNHSFALGNNLAMPAVHGEVVVFLNNDTEAQAGWLEPLLDALADPEVLGAQSLLLYPSGAIQSAGVAFPSCGGIPRELLQGFPREDAIGLERARFSGLTAAAMAMRRRDFLEVRGFDPLFRNGMEDADLCLRMIHKLEGYFAVRPDSVVLHHESKTPGRFVKSLVNRRILLDRWRNRMPGDDVELWGHAGYEVIRHEVGPHVSEDRRLTPPLPILRRRVVDGAVDSNWPSLRWAIKNPAPNDPSAEFWGDTHFARLLAAALRGLGQQVVIDHRPAFDRASGLLDDVVLVLRGVAPYRPQYGQINLGWLISHPEMLRRDEASSYDRLFAASVSWASEKSRAWGIRVDPLLQATDPSLFNPDRARPDTGHPVLFVGSSRRKVRPIVRDAIEVGMPVAIFGREWGGIVPDEYVKAEYLPNDLVGSAYRAAGLVLNDHWEDMRIGGFLSNRLFDAVAAGARVISDDIVGLEGVFGRSVQVARDEEDLARFAALNDLDEVFGDDEERRAVAARVHAEHSFGARARTLLDAALEIRSQLGEQPRHHADATSRVG